MKNDHLYFPSLMLISHYHIKIMVLISSEQMIRKVMEEDVAWDLGLDPDVHWQTKSKNLTGNPT
jgi:hypothetical protein